MLAVFDLDGTLLDSDSTALWLWERVRRSWARTAATLLVAPVAVPMVLVPCTRQAGASILLWIATAGLSEAGWNELRGGFSRLTTALAKARVPNAGVSAERA